MNIFLTPVCIPKGSSDIAYITCIRTDNSVNEICWIRLSLLDYVINGLVKDDRINMKNSVLGNLPPLSQEETVVVLHTSIKVNIGIINAQKYIWNHDVKNLQKVMIEAKKKPNWLALLIWRFHGSVIYQ